MGEFSILLVLAGFGGGILGTYMGPLPSFILTGIAAMIGGIVSLAGGADLSVGFITFGAFLGPHIAFAGGVAAAAYASKKKLLSTGSDILSSLYGLNDPMTLVVGGCFGALGAVVYQLLAIVGVPTDLPAITVVILAVITRLMFSTKGLTGKYEGKEKRQYIPTGKSLGNVLMLGLGLGILIAFGAMVMIEGGVSQGAMGAYPIIIFGIAAASLLFTQVGFATPATHHIVYPAACVAIWSGIPMLAIVFAVLGAFIGEIMTKTFNSHCDTHIDAPASTITILLCAAILLFL